MTAQLPRYVALHEGARARVLRRCMGDNCYAPYADVASISDAKTLADTLNRAEKP